MAGQPRTTCKRGHNNWKFVPGRGSRLCIDCNDVRERRPGLREKRKEWKESNRERISKMRRERYLLDIERNKARARLWWLRKKEDAGKITEGEIEQMLEIALKYPSRNMAAAC